MASGLFPAASPAEAKRDKMLELFHESKEIYNMKELEKLGPKLKGPSISLS